jgi:transposase
VRLEALITALDQPPAPLAAATTRALVQALLYRALTDGAWDALPAWAPPATLVAATYRRWQQLGLLAQLSAELRVCLSRDDASS